MEPRIVLKKSHSLIFFLLSLLLPLLSNYTFAVSYKFPRLSPYLQTKLHGTQSSNIPSFGSNDLKIYYYTQTLDHFNYAPGSYATFKQRYAINAKYFGGAKANSPIFAYLGAESPMENEVPTGFLTNNAPRFKALQVYIEHRFYGKSIPFGSMEDALKNKTTRGYFNSAQALADYAEVLMHVKKTFSTPNSPIIVIGGSYGGMLASWFRLKYPHVAIGALASSAPILYFDNITPHQGGYYSIVTKDFKKTSENCYRTIKRSWSEIDKVASEHNGVYTLSKKFKTCSPLNNSYEMKDFLDTLYAVAAQYNLPTNRMKMICSGIDGASKGSNDILQRIAAGVFSYMGNSTTCIDTNQFMFSSETTDGWGWQTCSEMVMPIGRGDDTMFPASPFVLEEFIKNCVDKYGVSPRPHWITTYYGAHDIKLVLERFASNIIFSNGLGDPYSSGGVLQDISKTLVAVYTVNGSHCLDIYFRI
ncbi:hypothetical protein Leryth_011763 [Lithospermum erythrorhizon]|nr:hypothetical protein Leryth_011763 [Lithospermum erythrorhizon]